MTQKKDDAAYLGNGNLKRAGVNVEYTHEQMFEYLKCARDPIYFIKTYCKIINVDNGLVPFILRPFQEDMIRTFEANRFTICKMPRQVGKTVCVAAYFLWKALFSEDFNTAILANKDSNAKEILARIQLMYEHIPMWLQQGVLEWNKKSIKLENGSRIMAAATSSSAVRGGSFNMVYLDEFAFIQPSIQEEFFASVYPTISSGNTSKIIITSTPKGLNMFYKIWVDSEEGRNTYARVDVHWSMIPGRDEAWKEETIRNTSEEQFREEFECEFLGSSSTLISAVKLRQMAFKNPLMKNELGLKVYEEVDAGSIYILVADSSHGTGQDYSAFIVVNISKKPYTLAATFRNNSLSPQVFPDVILETAKIFNQAVVLIETNDIGQQVADILHFDLEYENVLCGVNNGREGQILTAGFSGQPHYGVRTTKTVKKIGCAALKTLVESDTFIIIDYDTIYELSRFVAKGQSFEAEDGFDDLAMCCVIFSWSTTQKYIKDLSSLDIRQHLSDQNAAMISEEMLPFTIFRPEDVEVRAVIDDTQEKYRHTMEEEERQLLMS